MSEIPERAGLLIVKKIYDLSDGSEEIKLEQIRGCKRSKGCEKWNEENRYQLARLGAMRIMGLKQKIIKLKK